MVLHSVDTICSVKFNMDQKLALVEGPAREAFGDFAEWTNLVLQKMCKILEALPVEDILKLPANAVSAVSQFFYFVEHLRVLLFEERHKFAYEQTVFCFS